MELYLVTDENLCLGRNLEQVVEAAVHGGVTMVQLREKNLSTRQFLDRARLLHNLLKPHQIPLIINDRVDIALAIDAEGVHVGQDDMPVAEVRNLLGSDKIVGYSVENINQALEAENMLVDYLGVSPVYVTPTKVDLVSQWGIEGLRALRKITSHKLVAIGGIKESNLEAVSKAGADGIAVVSAICSAPDPKKAARNLLTLIKKAKTEA